MGWVPRDPEQPRWTLMLKPNGQIVPVKQEDAHLKFSCGWMVVARESDVLPFNVPRLIYDSSDPREDGA